MIWLRAATLAVLALYPVAWAAPLLRAGLLPLFGLSDISILSGILALWDSDRFLALLVAVFALLAPMAKMLWMLGLQFGRIRPGGWRVLEGIGRLAMADLFLIAIYITVAKGIGMGRVETAWGLYLFAGCVLGSIVLGYLTERRMAG
ncbi:MAG: paraquat-inducible protein A [Marinibacterium sp.]|nr:paraquat-inducible protein A [Marinibacterium sp.]